MKELIEKSFLGTGWSFPPAFENVSSQVKMISGEDDVYNSLWVLLLTRVAERIMQPAFGCNLDTMLFEPLTTTLKRKMKDLITSAIINYEPRIALNDVILSGNSDEGVVLIEVQYTIIATNSRYNLVYPFYLTEGTQANG